MLLKKKNVVINVPDDKAKEYIDKGFNEYKKPVAKKQRKSMLQ